MKIILAAIVSLGLASASAYAKPADISGYNPAQQQTQQTPGIGWG
ncbi:MAG TPA: hypothetical protein VHS58_01790 [Acetobacteraceae bacterium]|jgi:hypothetical protein|nr:hypothetical protein [Acetobacteraceae bacterium]